MRSTPETDTEPALLSIRDLAVTFSTPGGPIRAVDGVSLDVHAGEVLAVVGESGSGKSQTALAVTGLLAANGAADGSIRWQRSEILGLPEHRLARLRCDEIAMIFQNPMTSLNPYLRVSSQMMEGITLNGRMTKIRGQDRLYQDARIRPDRRCRNPDRPVSPRVFRRHAAADHDRHVPFCACHAS